MIPDSVDDPVPNTKLITAARLGIDPCPLARVIRTGLVNGTYLTAGWDGHFAQLSFTKFADVPESIKTQVLTPLTLPTTARTA